VVGMLAAAAVRLAVSAWKNAGVRGLAPAAATAAWMMSGGSPVAVVLATVVCGALAGWTADRRERRRGGGT